VLAVYDPLEFPLDLKNHIPPRLRGLVDVLLTGAGCWEWTGRLNRNGYGRVLVDGKEVAAHRFVYQAMLDSIGPAIQLDHTCNNRKCVNPEHMEKVSLRENCRRRDERRKNRGEWTRDLIAEGV
jgi:hypothetical protein